MKILTISIALALGASCMGIGSCKAVAVNHAVSHKLGCSHAEEAMLALERNEASAINTAVSLMSCYDGAYAERVDVALGNLVVSHSHAVFASMHKQHFDKAMINDIVNTQPWDMVDKPCQFVSELKRRVKAINRVKSYPREVKLAKKSLAEFIPIVSANCSATSKDEVSE